MVIDGRYVVVRTIGQGRLGAVYEVEAPRGGDRLALRLVPDQRVDAASLAAIRAGVEAHAATLGPRHGVRLVEVGCDATAGLFEVRELLRGESVASRVQRAGRWARDDLQWLLRSLGAALGGLHARGLAHRDLRPETLFLVEGGGALPTLKIFDLGLQEALAATSAGEGARGALRPAYAAPEQLVSVGAVTPAADVWALGLVAFYLVTGRHYWPTANGEALHPEDVRREVLSRSNAPFSARSADYGVPTGPQFDAWFSTCIAWEPSDRFVDVAACVTAFESALAGAPVEPPPAAEPSHETQPLRATPFAPTAPLPRVVVDAVARAPGGETAATQPLSVVAQATVAAASSGAATPNGVAAPGGVRPRRPSLGAAVVMGLVLAAAVTWVLRRAPRPQPAPATPSVTTPRTATAGPRAAPRELPPALQPRDIVLRSNPFAMRNGVYIQRMEVSRGEYNLLVARESLGEAESQLPVVKIGHAEAAAWCARLDARLPTRAEWAQALGVDASGLPPWARGFTPELQLLSRADTPIALPTDENDGYRHALGNVNEWVDATQHEPFQHAMGGYFGVPHDDLEDYVIHGTEERASGTEHTGFRCVKAPN